MLRQTTIADYEAQTDIRYGAARGWVDAIIAPDKTREVLIEALGTATRPGPTGGFRAGVLQTCVAERVASSAESRVCCSASDIKSLFHGAFG